MDGAGANDEMTARNRDSRLPGHITRLLPQGWGALMGFWRMAFPHRLLSSAPLPALALALACSLRLGAQVTEVPQTIEPGHFLVRMDAVSAGVKPDTSAPDQYKALAFGSTIVSGGITDSLDFEVAAQLFIRDTYTVMGANRTQSGIGDVSLRSKWTFWRDPDSHQAAAVIPYIKLPTNSNGVDNHFVEGGVILPWAMDVGAGVKAGAMLEWDELRNVADTRYDSRWYASGVVNWDLAGKVGAYVESTLSVSTAGSSSFAGTAGGGATLAVSNNFRWDVEVSRVLGHGRSQWLEVLRFNWKL